MLFYHLASQPVCSRSIILCTKRGVYVSLLDYYFSIKKVLLQETACSHDCRSRLKIFCRKVLKGVVALRRIAWNGVNTHHLVLSIIADIVNHESALGKFLGTDGVWGSFFKLSRWGTHNRTPIAETDEAAEVAQVQTRSPCSRTPLGTGSATVTTFLHPGTGLQEEPERRQCVRKL